MSTTPEAPPPPPLQQRSGCATAVMVILGIILLLPGLCALFFGAVAISGRSFPSDIVSFMVMGILSGFVGVILIRLAIRGRRS
jgi:uncharacterized membrane protein HdeD (DUF308 family)